VGFRATISTIGTFHSFDMARQLEKAGALVGIFTGYPRFKIHASGIPAGKIHCFPWLHGPYMAGWIPGRLQPAWEYLDRVSFDAYVATVLENCDVFCGLSGSALRTGVAARRRGIRFACDRGSTHIRFQDKVLREEHDLWGLSFRGVDPRIVEREEREYDLADAILVPSRFARQTFLDQGIAPEKIHLVPYGVDLSRFAPVARPREAGFDMLFVGGLSVRKGAEYLFAAFERVQANGKSLTIVGTVGREIAPSLDRFAARHPEVRVLGPLPQWQLKDYMSRSHVLVLPSVEEGLALVQAQALACGCPVVASRNTGAEDLFTDGVEGYIVAPRDVDALCAALQDLADDVPRRERFSRAALQRVAEIGGWDRYGQAVLQTFSKMLAPAAEATMPKPEFA
jgi:glycosyltransferase involved in cell wall biosynthesis